MNFLAGIIGGFLVSAGVFILLLRRISNSRDSTVVPGGGFGGGRPEIVCRYCFDKDGNKIDCPGDPKG